MALQEDTEPQELRYNSGKEASYPCSPLVQLQISTWDKQWHKATGGNHERHSVGHVAGKVCH